MASAVAKAMVSEDALIWAKVKKILRTKGIDAAISALKEIRADQHFKLYAANQLFRQI